MSSQPVVPQHEINQVAEQVVAQATPSAAPATTPKKYYATIYPGPDKDVDSIFALAVKKLEAALQCPVWLIIQNEKSGALAQLVPSLYNQFYASRHDIIPAQPVALLIDSPGGNAATAFKIGRLFQRRASKFKTIIPKYAKSAATLLALSGNSIILGEDAELGPLDVQMFDLEREEYGSALNAVQSLERLNAFSMTTIDQMTPLLMQRTGRKLDILLPIIMNYTVSFVRPLLEKIDTVDFTKKSRELKVAEEYAYRLMLPNYSHDTAVRVAQHLVDKYPTHGFAIDRDEASVCESEIGFGLGLNVETLTPELNSCLDSIIPFVDRLTVIGQIKERTNGNP